MPWALAENRCSIITRIHSIELWVEGGSDTTLFYPAVSLKTLSLCALVIGTLEERDLPRLKEQSLTKGRALSNV